MIKLRSQIREVKSGVTKCFSNPNTLIRDLGDIITAENDELLGWLKADLDNIKKVSTILTCLESVERKELQRLASFAKLYIDCFLANMEMEEKENRGVITVELSRIIKSWRDTDFFVGGVTHYDAINPN